MRQYVLDEIAKADIGRVKDWLSGRADLSGVAGLYWVDFAPDLLSDTQTEHKGCQPHCFAVELGDDFVKFELLVRSRVNYRCRACQVYATEQQRRFILEFADRMVTELGLMT